MLAAFGAAAAVAALGTSELLAGAINRAPSLILAIADVIIDETPGGIARWSIDNLGSSQKPALVTGIVVVSTLIGAALGVAVRRRFTIPVAGFLAFGVIGGWAAARDPLTGDQWAWFAAAVSAAVGVGALWLAPHAASDHAPAAEDATPARPTPAMRAVDRRRFLVTGTALTTWGIAAGGIGKLWRESRSVEAARQRVAAKLGTATSPSTTIPSGLTNFDSAVDGISPIVTPTEDFYRIDTRIMVPQIDPDGWTLRVTGMVDRDVELTFDDLLAMDRIEEYITLSCVSNEVGGELVDNAVWSGVPLNDVLALAGPSPDATQIVGRAVDDWTAGFPTEVATDGRPAMVAITMNGEPLTAKHGFPARLVVPGLYGYVSATKWLAEIELTTWEAFDGYWIPRGWSKEGPIKTQSRIDVPGRGDKLAAGATAVAGVAWAPTRLIQRVEVRVDDGDWQEAQLSGALSDHSWVQWVYEWDAAPGEHRIQVRATDGEGVTQTDDVSPPAPSGATGYHTVSVEVT